MTDADLVTFLATVATRVAEEKGVPVTETEAWQAARRLKRLSDQVAAIEKLTRPRKVTSMREIHDRLFG